MKLSLLAVSLSLLPVLALPTPVLDGTIDGSIRHRVIDGLEALVVSVFHRQNVYSGDKKVSQAATGVIYRYPLPPSNPSPDGEYLPVQEPYQRVSSFATIIPNESEGYYEGGHGQGSASPTEDDDEQRREPLLWVGAKSEFTPEIEVRIESVDATNNRIATVFVSHHGSSQQISQVSLPPVSTILKAIENTPDSVRGKPTGPFLDSHLGSHIPGAAVAAAAAAGSNAATVVDQNGFKTIMLHYYRNLRCARCYGTVEESFEYLSAAVIGFLSPIALFGIALLIIACGVFACTDLWGSTREPRELTEKQKMQLHTQTYDV